YGKTGDAKRDMAAANIYLVNDIEISGNIAKGLFDEEMPFTGVFDGGVVDADGVTIKNRKITFNGVTLGDLTLQSLFGVSKGTIKNVDIKVSNLSVVGKAETVYVGSLVSKNYGKITNCNVDNFNFNNSSSAGGKLVIGGITAINGVGAEISKCSVVGSATSEINGKNIIFGGIAGINTGLILRSNVTGLVVTVNAKVSQSTVVGGLMAGGIVGKMSESGSIRQCEFKNLTLTCASDFDNANAGGVVGFMSSVSAVSECFGNGAITVAAKGANAGGIAGRTNGTIQDCYVADCEVSATSDVYYARAGGIAGDTSSEGTRNIQIKQCYTGDNVKINATVTGAAKASAGGIVGNSAWLTVSWCFSMANVAVATPADSEKLASLGLIVGSVTKNGTEDSSVIKEGIYYLSSASLKLNGVEYKVEKVPGEKEGETVDKPNFAATVKGVNAEKTDFVSVEWLEAKVKFLTDKNYDPAKEGAKVPVWHASKAEDTDKVLPTLFYAL
ncbi:MAG: hypothetical protein RR405_05245, partial [Clostridia bacterium]